MRTTRAAFCCGNGFSNTAFSTLNMAVLAPMPSASVVNTAAVNPRLARKVFRALLMSKRRLIDSSSLVSVALGRGDRHDASRLERESIEYHNPVRQNAAALSRVIIGVDVVRRTPSRDRVTEAVGRGRVRL
jgi:hypothetical protein